MGMVNTVGIVPVFTNARVLFVDGRVPGKPTTRLAYLPALHADPGATRCGHHGGEMGGGSKSEKFWKVVRVLAISITRNSFPQASHNTRGRLMPPLLPSPILNLPSTQDHGRWNAHPFQTPGTITSLWRPRVHSARRATYQIETRAR